jgi:homocysteine S-methyltransferase
MGAIFEDDWPFILGPGSMYERLRRDARVNVEPHIFHAAMLYDDDMRDLLTRIYREYADIAQAHRLPYLVGTVTWRASAARIEASSCAGLPVNRDAAGYLREFRDSYGSDAAPMVMAGLLGPMGDAYKPAEAPPRDQARRFHAPQVEELGDTGLDCLDAKTLPALEEALGIADLIAETDKPYLLSFVVLPSGTLLDGTPLGDAIARIDDEVARPPEHYAVNCVHPRNYAKALYQMGKTHPGAQARIIGLEANTSARTPEELDKLEEVETRLPEEFAREVWALRKSTGARYLCGCCGSGTEHIEALARAAAEDLMAA